MKNLFTLVVLAVMAFAAQAVELTVAEGSNEAQYAPFYGMYMDTRGTLCQAIYPADMLADMQGATITAIKFYPTAALKDFGSAKLQVALKEVEQDRFSSTQIVEGATVVATNLTPEMGATEFVVTLAEPFVYNGGNLMIETTVTETGNYPSTKFFGETYDYAIGLAQYTYSWSDTYYYETENVLPKATFTYEGGSEEPGITLLSEANALEDNAQFTFNGDAVVTVCKDGYVFLRDQSGFGQIAGFTGTLENGQVLNQGWNATKTSITDGWVRYTDATNITATGVSNSALAAPIVLTGAVDESMLNAYVVIENQPKSFFPARSYTLPDGTTIAKTETLWSMNAPAASKPYNVYGIICKVNGTFMINPVDFQDYVEPVEEWQLGDVNHDHSVDVNDVTMMISYILGTNPTPFYLTEANVDGDAEGAIDVNDVTATINIILTAN